MQRCPLKPIRPKRRKRSKKKEERTDQRTVRPTDKVTCRGSRFKSSTIALPNMANPKPLCTLLFGSQFFLLSLLLLLCSFLELFTFQSQFSVIERRLQRCQRHVRFRLIAVIVTSARMCGRRSWHALTSSTHVQRCNIKDTSYTHVQCCDINYKQVTRTLKKTTATNALSVSDRRYCQVLL